MMTIFLKNLLFICVLAAIGFTGCSDILRNSGSNALETTMAVKDSVSFRVATYNVLSDHYKNPQWEHVRHIADWGNCSDKTRCHMVKSMIETTKADLLALQEIPRAAFDVLKNALAGYTGKHFSSTTKLRNVEHIDGVALFWKHDVFEEKLEPAIGFNTHENKAAGETDRKPAMLLYLTPKGFPELSVGVASVHFGDSIYQNDEHMSGRSKMAAIIGKFREASVKYPKLLQVILGDFNQDQYFKEGYDRDVPGKGRVVYDVNRDKIKLALENGYISGAIDSKGTVDHALSLSWTSPHMAYELDPPHEDLRTKKLGNDRFIDWGLFKAWDPLKLKVMRVHGSFDHFALSYAGTTPTIQAGEAVLRASDHLPVVFDVTLTTK